MLDTLEWAKRKRDKAYNKTKINPNSSHLKNEYEQWNLIMDKLMKYETLIDPYELLRKLEHMEKFNNSDVPQWVKNVIKGTTKKFDF